MSRPKSDWAETNKEELYRLYVTEENSIPQIAEKLGVNSQKVYRSLNELRIKTRSRSEAQAVALKHKRATHPTKDRGELSLETRTKLSESIAKSWANISEEEKQRRSEVGKKQYENLSEKKKRDLHYSAACAIRISSVAGSKLERFLVDKLAGLSYNVVSHRKGYIINENLEIDILLPAQKIAIEVDGVFHSENVFGELGKVIHRDEQKNGLLLAAGYVVIRLENTSKSCSLHYKNKKLAQLLECIQKIEKEFPPLDFRLIRLTDEDKK